MKKLMLMLITIAMVSLMSFDIMGCATCGCQTKKAADAPEVKFIDKDQVQQMIKENKDLVIIDVLSPESFAKAHIDGAINIPLAKLNDEKILKSLDKEKTYIVYCASTKCQASVNASKILLANGFKKVFDYKAGIADWTGNKLPTGTANLCDCGQVKGSPACCK